VLGHLTRREAIFALLATDGSAAMPAGAQTTAPVLPRVVIVNPGNEASLRPYRDQFVQGMRESGQMEGRTFRLDVLYANGDPTRVPGLIREAAAGRPDVLVVAGLAAARHARDATSTVPVVVATASDLVDAGVVKSLARPGGNVTGITDLVDELVVKRLELLKEALPRASRVALLVNPDFPATPKIETRARTAARTLGLEVSRLDARDPASLVAALDSLKQSRPDALLLGGDSLFTVRAQEVIDRVSAMRIPVVHYWPGTAENGALFSYQANIRQNYRRAAFYVDRILKGTQPGDLPIEQPTQYELVVNLKTAKRFGLSIPDAFLVRADRVIR
jgi:putative ABC transport system substrate-binding protein